MKPKEFINKYNLEAGWKSSYQNNFLQDFNQELLAFLEYNKAQDNIKGFDNAVKVIKMKWDSISNKIPFGLPEKLWSYFYATTVAKLKEELCPREMERRRQEKEDRKKRNEEYHRFIQQENDLLYSQASEAFYERLAMLYMFVTSIPRDSFEYLSLSEKSTEDQIKQRYREMSLEKHPDKGGSQEDFIELTKHKNRCLKYVSNQISESHES